MGKFWIVWRVGGQCSTVMHDTQESAESEAERLARWNPGERFVVLESLKFCTSDNPIHWYDLKEDR